MSLCAACVKEALQGLEDGEEGGEEVDFDSGDGGEAEETVFDLGGELGGGGFVGGGGVEGDVGDVARGEVGDVGAGGVGVGGEVGGADEVGVYDVGAGGGVAVAEEVEEVGVGHRCWVVNLWRGSVSLYRCRGRGFRGWAYGCFRKRK